MTDSVETARTLPGRVQIAPRGASSPAGLQTIAELSHRRWLVLSLNVATWLAMMLVAAKILGAGGWTSL
ncbi:MAG: hypothetical protein AB7L90_10710, partial [Hyphomicrobiaceae bacterium]